MVHNLLSIRQFTADNSCSIEFDSSGLTVKDSASRRRRTSALVLHRSSSAELVVYTDADWAGCPDTRRSTSGYAVFLGGNLVSWSSKRQPVVSKRQPVVSKRQSVVSRSSAEAEYRAVANGVAEASWLRQLLAELHSPLAKSTLVYCDNVNAVYLSTNPVQH